MPKWTSQLRAGKVKCQYCERICHKKGLTNHERHCVKNQQGVDTSSVATPDQAAEIVLNRIWNRLNVEQKFLAIAEVVRMARS